jgi:tetratricopeptide (TPR) repeat protein
MWGRIIRGILGVKPEPSPEEKETWRRRCEGTDRYLAGRKHCVAKRWREALECFDQALELDTRLGYDLQDFFGDRAMCLQALGFHLDAIDDFDKAIDREPDDCNLYFMRAMSMRGAGRYEDADEDFRRAIALSKVKNERNRGYDAHANEKEMGGWPSAAAVYEAQKRFNDLDLEASGAVQELLKERLAEKTLRREKR